MSGPRRRPEGDPSAAEVDALVRASRALVGVAARSVGSLPETLTLPQVRALVVLSSRGPTSAGALAEVLGVHPSSLTRLVDRLERRGLVTRRPSTSDRREVVVAITTRGERLVQRMTEARRRDLAAILAQLQDADRAWVVGAFERFATVAGEAGGDAWALGWDPGDAGTTAQPESPR